MRLPLYEAILEGKCFALFFLYFVLGVVAGTECLLVR